MAITIKGDQFQWKGRPIRLAGSHTWNTVQPMAGERIGLDKITGNFTKLWTIETKGLVASNSLWGSNTPGFIKVDNVPWKKDGSLNPAYYDNLGKAVKRADKRDMITMVSLFEGSIQDIFDQAWENHPFNGLGPKDHDEVHTKGKWNKYQRAHVKRVVQTLEKHDNVMYEVGNELMGSSVPWFQRQVVKWIKKWTDKPVGVSYARGIRPSNGRQETWMGGTGADFILPEGSTRDVPWFKGPAIRDSDHDRPLFSPLASFQESWRKSWGLLLMDGVNGTFLRNQESMASAKAFIEDVLA
jgi:hypothetical protein